MESWLKEEEGIDFNESTNNEEFFPISWDGKNKEYESNQAVDKSYKWNS